MPRRTLLLIAALTMASAILYATRLGYAPVYLMHDESQFALQAASIASSGRDLAGHLLPVFFTEPEFPAGRDPAVIYLTAAALTWLPVSEANVRLPTALLGVLNVVLMFLLARRLFGRDWMALVAAGFLVLTPAHFIRSRLILSPQSSLPIIMAWLLCLAVFSERPGTRRLAAGAAWLGVGAYTYLAWVVIMPVYLVLTGVLGYRLSGRRSLLVAAAAFAVPLLPMGWWYLTHPERVTQVVDAYQLAGGVAAGRPSLDAGLAALRAKAGLFWSFFGPEYLFISGDSSMINSTRMAGLFPMSFAVLIPLGIVHLAQLRRGIHMVILAGLLTAPIPAIISGALEMNRILFVIPFGVLAAAYGVDWLIASQTRWAQVAAIALVAAVPLQFAGFYGDYMGRYRIESASWFGGNTRDALIAALERTSPDSNQHVYLSPAIPFAARYWRFYALANGRADMLDRAVHYTTRVPEGETAGDQLVCPVETAECQSLMDGQAGWHLVRTITEPNGAPSFALLEKTGS